MVNIQITTDRFGVVDVDEKSVIYFASPILGFDKLEKYVVLDHSENSPFKWLQSTEDSTLAFVITNPRFFGMQYEFLLPDDVVEKLEIKKAEDVLVFTIVNIPDDNPAKMTVNLMAPIVINQLNLRAMQVVLQDSGFTTRTPLLSKEKQTSSATKTSDKR